MKRAIIALTVVIAVGVVLLGFMGVELESSADMNNVTDIRITTRNQRVHIRPISGNEARVEAIGVFPGSTLWVEVESGLLSIDVWEPRMVDFRPVNFVSSHLIVYLPDEVYETLFVQTSNGRVYIGGFEIGELTVQTTNGRVYVDDIVGNVDIRTSNGRIYASNIVGEMFEVRSSSGRLNLIDITGNIRGETSNGAIYFNNPTIEQDINLITSNGRVIISLDEKPENASFRLQTTNSRISLFGYQNERWEIGDGRYEIDIRTSNGRITVE